MDVSCHWVTKVVVHTDEIASPEAGNFFRTQILVTTKDGEHCITLFPEDRDEPLVLQIEEVTRL